MKERLAELVGRLRRAEVAVSVAEAMDAAQAVALLGIERHALRDALAATLVKDECERPVFLAAFDATFPARPHEVRADQRRTRTRRRAAAEGEGEGAGSGLGDGASAAGTGSSHAEMRPARSAAARDPSSGIDPRSPSADRDAADHQRARGEGDAQGDTDAGKALARLGRERRLSRLPFRAMTAADVAECAALARAITVRVAARVRRRLQPRATGRLDFRRTIRAAVPRGGVAFERRYRRRRRGTPDLVALVDLSASAATATAFFLSLLAPAGTYFRRVRLFGYVDRLVEIEFEAGQVRPAAPIDLMARSDFGRVLRDLADEEAAVLGADTVLVVLGDARNNRRPPRADLLAAARARVRRLLWLNPDPQERWNTGDSVIATYARHVDAVVACGTLAELERAIAAVAAL